MIAIGCDHGGYQLKEKLKRYLDEKDIKYKDLGVYSEERADYPLIAKEVANAIQEGKCEKGILICRSGAGMSIVANKFRGIRCVDCNNEESAIHARNHNDANIIAIGADYVSESEAVCIVRALLATEAFKGRYQERLEMIKEIENQNMK